MVIEAEVDDSDIYAAARDKRQFSSSEVDNPDIYAAAQDTRRFSPSLQDLAENWSFTYHKLDNGAHEFVIDPREVTPEQKSSFYIARDNRLKISHQVVGNKLGQAHDMHEHLFRKALGGDLDKLYRAFDLGRKWHFKQFEPGELPERIPHEMRNSDYYIVPDLEQAYSRTLKGLLEDENTIIAAYETPFDLPGASRAEIAQRRKALREAEQRYEKNLALITTLPRQECFRKWDEKHAEQRRERVELEKNQGYKFIWFAKQLGVENLMALALRDMIKCVKPSTEMLQHELGISGKTAKRILERAADYNKAMKRADPVPSDDFIKKAIGEYMAVNNTGTLAEVLDIPAQTASQMLAKAAGYNRLDNPVRVASDSLTLYEYYRLTDGSRLFNSRLQAAERPDVRDYNIELTMALSLELNVPLKLIMAPPKEIARAEEKMAQEGGVYDLNRCTILVKNAADVDQVYQALFRDEATLVLEMSDKYYRRPGGYYAYHIKSCQVTGKRGLYPEEVKIMTEECFHAQSNYGHVFYDLRRVSEHLNPEAEGANDIKKNREIKTIEKIIEKYERQIFEIAWANDGYAPDQQILLGPVPIAVPKKKKIAYPKKSLILDMLKQELQKGQKTHPELFGEETASMAAKVEKMRDKALVQEIRREVERAANQKNAGAVDPEEAMLARLDELDRFSDGSGGKGFGLTRREARNQTGQNTAFKRTGDVNGHAHHSREASLSRRQSPEKIARTLSFQHP